MTGVILGVLPAGWSIYRQIRRPMGLVENRAARPSKPVSAESPRLDSSIPGLTLTRGPSADALGAQEQMLPRSPPPLLTELCA